MQSVANLCVRNWKEFIILNTTKACGFFKIHRRKTFVQELVNIDYFDSEKNLASVSKTFEQGV